MGCSGRQKAADIRADQKWDFISLNDFKSTSCWTPFAYAYLIGSLLVSIAVYGVDTFTAVNLLVFDRWSGKIKPEIPLNISKWIFSACIIASWVNLGYEYLRAIRVIKRGAVAESYLDSLAVRIQCIRPGKSGRGWRRFLVFAELTKSKKGAEYVALFTYFSFQAWIRVIFCQGPRQVVNALTLYAVFKAQLIPSNVKSVESAIGGFFQKIGFLAEQDNQQAVILSGMLFTLVIWVFAALSLMLAVLFYVFYLWGHIPNRDGGLSGYCENKTNKRLAAIVSDKVNKAIEDEERQRRKADAKALKKGEKPVFGRQATLPTLFNPQDSKSEDKLPQMPMLNRNDTISTLPLYSSRPGTPSGGPPTVGVFELDQLDNKRPAPSRNGTGTSYGSNAPLMNNASEMGYNRSASPAPTLPLDRNGYPFPQRPGTASSQSSQFNRGPQRMPSAFPDRGYTASPATYNDPSFPSSHMSNNSQDSMNGYGRSVLGVGNERSNTPSGPPPSMGPRMPFDPRLQIDRNGPASYAGSEYGRGSPAPPRGPGSDFGRNSPVPSRGPGSDVGINSPAFPRGPGSDVGVNMSGPPRGPVPDYGRNSPAPSAVGSGPMANGGYQAYNPNQRSASSAEAFRPGPSPQASRNMTDPSMGSRGPLPGSLDYSGNGVTPQRAVPPHMVGPNIARLASPGAYNGRNSPAAFSPNGPQGGSFR